MHLYYLAYGSNLHPVRLQRRTPSCRIIGQAILTSYRLQFHKLGKDGSGKCNAFFTGNADDRVIGIIYKINYDDKSALDDAEGAGYGYNIEEFSIKSENNRYNVFSYLADPAYIEDSVSPFSWYKNLVIHGAKFHRFPDTYIKNIESVGEIQDPDRARHQKLQQIATSIIPSTHISSGLSI